MRISDWSSDVCSSDLQRIGFGQRLAVDRKVAVLERDPVAADRDHALDQPHAVARRLEHRDVAAAGFIARHHGDVGERNAQAVRSEEHTSELQSLMRISYAVFCLKKTTNKTHHNT